MNIEETAGKNRYSRKREAILSLIRSTNAHPGAQWVYDQLKASIPNLSLGTVYRNIGVFREEGSAVSLGVVNGEERFDGCVEPHPHAVCRHCGKIVDLPAEVKSQISAGFSVEVPGFSIDMRNTVFYGVCSGCLETTA